MVASAHHTHLYTWTPAAPWDGYGDGYIHTTAILDYEYTGTVWLCTLGNVTLGYEYWVPYGCVHVGVHPDMYTRISTCTTALWRQLGATTMALADPCSTTGWIYTTGVLDAADLVINWQLAYIAGSSGYRRYMTLA